MYTVAQADTSAMPLRFVFSCESFAEICSQPIGKSRSSDKLQPLDPDSRGRAKAGFSGERRWLHAQGQVQSFESGKVQVLSCLEVEP